MTPTFKNVANKLVQGTDGNNYWISRSCAVVGLVIAKYKGFVYVLLEKRSEIMDEPNKYALPSGYIDFNENGYEGIERELFEETGFYIPNFRESLKFNNNNEPFYVHTDPNTDAKQNVSLTYIFIYDFSRIEMPMQIENFKNHEIAEVKWCNITDLPKSELFAFHHLDRIDLAINKYFDLIF